MQKNIEMLLNELESFGIYNDSNTNDSALRMKNITKDAGEFIKEQADGTFDFIFLDSDRKQYMNWWEDLNRILKDKSLLVVDNVNSHREEVAEFINVIRSSEAHDSLIVSVGKGQLMIFKK